MGLGEYSRGVIGFHFTYAMKGRIHDFPDESTNYKGGG